MVCFSVNLASLFLHQVKILIFCLYQNSRTDGQQHGQQHYQIVEEEGKKLQNKKKGQTNNYKKKLFNVETYGNKIEKTAQTRTKYNFVKNLNFSWHPFFEVKIQRKIFVLPHIFSCFSLVASMRDLRYF